MQKENASMGFDSVNTEGHDTPARKQNNADFLSKDFLLSSPRLPLPFVVAMQPISYIKYHRLTK